ncbi:MAG: NMP kinase [Thermoproteota archaeon]|nr:MAG: NMP kinase [Candidatus Korarchaeota archaeon]
MGLYKLVALTGVPCVGKSTVANILAKYEDVEVVNLNRLIIEKFSVESEGGVKTADMEALEKHVRNLKSDKTVILEGHLSHLLPVDIAIVLRCEPKLLYERLLQRYGIKGKCKIIENLEAEIIGAITCEARCRGIKTLEIDVSNKTPPQTAKLIRQILQGKDVNDFVNWLTEENIEFLHGIREKLKDYKFSSDYT